MHSRTVEVYRGFGWRFFARRLAMLLISLLAASFRFASWNLLDCLGWTVSVAASAYGAARLATGHHTALDIAIVVIGLGAATLVTITAVRRHRRHAARRPGDIADGPPEDPLVVR